jgi:hypothetical protein
MTANLFAWILAGTLVVPQAALGKDTTADVATRAPSQPGSWNALPLPPIPHLEAIPWLATAETEQRQKVDVLLGPKFESIKPGFELAPAQLPLQSRDAAMRSD